MDIDINIDNKPVDGVYLPRPAFENILSFLVAKKIDKTREKSNIQKVFTTREPGIYDNDKYYNKHMIWWKFFYLEKCPICNEPIEWRFIQNNYGIYRINANCCRLHHM